VIVEGFYAVAPIGGSIVEGMKKELVDHGAFTVGFYVYQDFFSFPFASGAIYTHNTSNNIAGGHAVAVVGYDTKDGIDFWLIANSWGKNWGDNGYFRMKRGVNVCNMESMAIDTARISINPDAPDDDNEDPLEPTTTSEDPSEPTTTSDDPLEPTTTTAPVTTEVPVTTTEAPTTQAPTTTQVQTTQSPTTQAPTTARTTEAPTTQATTARTTHATTSSPQTTRGRRSTASPRTTRRSRRRRGRGGRRWLEQVESSETDGEDHHIILS
jgi:hypothetical protein